MAQITLEQQQRMREFERGHRLAQLVRSEGWKELLDMMEEEAARDEFRLMNLPLDTPARTVDQIRIAARISRSKFEQIQLRINAAIEAAIPEEFSERFRSREDYLS